MCATCLQIGEKEKIPGSLEAAANNYLLRDWLGLSPRERTDYHPVAIGSWDCNAGVYGRVIWVIPTKKRAWWYEDGLYAWRERIAAKRFPECVRATEPDVPPPTL